MNIERKYPNSIKNLYLVPFIVVLSIPLLIYTFKQGDFRHVLAGIITIIIPLLIVNTSKINPFSFVVLSFPILALSIAFNAMALEYNSYISIGVWTALFDTDYTESSEFISDTFLITKIVTFFQIAVYIFYLFHSYRKKTAAIEKKYTRIFLVILVIFVFDFASKGATRIAFPFRAIEGVVKYKKQRMYEVQFFSERENMLVNSTQNDDFKKDELAALIIVVGESLRRDHLAYYGYSRSTTPYLNQEDIIPFTDAISPTNQTVNTLKRVFSAAEYENDTAYYQKPSFIKAFKETGFKTYWISTQRMYGEHDSEVSFIAKESDSIIFRNNYEHDGVLIKNLKDVLALDDPKKLIIIHILGSHASYDRRYPSEYNKFKKQEYSNSNNEQIDFYDNSVLYNDFVLYNFLSELKKVKGNNSFIMFSDHGESLFQTGPNRKAHSSLNPAKCEYEVPLVLWFSDEYKQNHPTYFQNVIMNKDQPVILSDFYHSVPSLYGIEFPDLIHEKNFFGNSYHPVQNRKVMDNSFEFKSYNKLKISYLDSD